MPTYDYLERLSFLHAMQLEEAEAARDPRMVRAAARAQVAELQEATAIAQSLRQPNAEGWIAETLLLQAALAESRHRLASAEGDKATAAAAAADRRAATAAYSQQVFADYDLGIGSLPTVAGAVFMTATEIEGSNPGGLSRQAADFRELVLLTTEDWSRRGAEIGRGDRVQESLLDSNQSRFRLAVMSKDSAGSASAFHRADQAAADMFRTRREFLERGTESLSGLTHAWLLRSQVQRMAVDADEQLFDPDRESALRGDLETLRTAAASIRDLRGRNLADVQFVQLISDTLPPAN